MNAGDYIACCAALIAIAALYVAIEQARLTRKHNRLSVRPYLAMYRKEFKNHPIEYVLENRGLGPAIVKKFSVLVDDHKVDAANTNVVLRALELLSLSGDGIGGHLLVETDSLGANQSITILQFAKSKDNPELYRALMDKMPRLKFRIEYQSMYGDDFAYYGNGD